MLGLTVALASASTFAFANSLQHRVAGTAPESANSVAAAARYVLSQPVWMLGLGLGGLGWVLHAVALDLAPLAVVHPALVAGVVLAVPVRAALDRRLPSRQEFTAVAITGSGLSAFLVVACGEPSAGVGDGSASLVMSLVGIAVAVAVSALSSRFSRPQMQALCLGAASGVLFGCTAGLLKIGIQGLAATSLMDLLFAWPTWALVVAGGLGLAFNQRAYQVAPLSASLPIVNVVDVIVAIAFGAFVFGEQPASDGRSLALQVMALAVTGFGVWRITCLEQPRKQPSATRRLHEEIGV